MLQVQNHTFIPQYMNRTSNFGRGADLYSVEYDNLSDESKAEKMKELAEKIKESNKGPSAVRSFLIVSILTAASALTGATVADRFYKVFNKVGVFEKITPSIPKLIEKASAKLNNIPPQDGIKAKIVNGFKYVLNSMENNSIYGIEEKLAKFNNEKAKKLSNIKRSVLRSKPELKGNNEAIQEAIDNKIAQTPDLQEFFKQNQRYINDLKGTNLSRKFTRVAGGTFTGVGALKEASRDEDQNGVPDCVEYAHAKKDAAQKVTAAILDCAFDTM